MALVILCNCIHNICTKSTPEGANTFLSLSVTYLVAAGTPFLLFFLSGHGATGQQLKQLNWTAPVLGLVCLGLEFGHICIYQAGWKVSAASLAANLCLACALLFVGVLLYEEVLTLRQAAGMLVCAVGLILICK